MSLEFKLFKKYPDLVYGLSEKSDGSMKLFDIPAESAANRENRKKYFAQFNIDSTKVIGTIPAHGIEVSRVTELDEGSFLDTVDGLITNDENLFLSFTVADCFPVYLYDPASRTLGLAHAGWRGIANGIITSIITKLITLGVEPRDLIACIGPGIQACHFEVRGDVVEQFKKYPPYIRGYVNKTFIDLPGILRRQFIDLGIPADSIEASELCTYHESQRYFSWRRDRPPKLEAMVAYIGLKEEIAPETKK